MTAWIESRLLQAEQRLEMLYRWILDLRNQLRAVQQGLIASQQQGNNGGQGLSGLFQWTPGSPVSGNTSVTGQTVYQFVAGVATALSGTYTVYNGLAAGLAASQACWVFPDGAGNFAVISQSCV